jgi:hypothetical protein
MKIDQEFLQYTPYPTTAPSPSNRAHQNDEQKN